MADIKPPAEKRQYERLPVDFPVVYKVGRHTLTGTTVNVSNEGFLIESSVSAKTGLNVFRILNKKPRYRLEVEYSYQGRTFLRDAQVRHFHIDSSGSGPYRLRIGFWIPKIE